MAEKEFFNDLKSEFKEWGSKVNRLFEDFVAKSKGESDASPAVDVYETVEELVYEADLPGFRKEDVKVQVRENRLVLRGQRYMSELQQNAKSVHTERAFGAFEREFPLPADVDANHIQAKFENGVLRISMPKVEVQSAESVIDIE